MNKLSDHQIISSWKKNIHPWVAAIREGEIESRLLITNKAIIDTILKKAPKTVLDVGCGEGWLARELSKSGINALGVDVIPEFIEYAKKKGGGRFEIISYNGLSDGELQETFDAIVCNFSLLGKDSVVRLFQIAPSLLNAGGSLIVQTIHPMVGCREGEYKDEWREGSWAGFSDDFCEPAPWYFRTMESWETLFLKNNFILETFEPINPKTKAPASVIFTGIKSGI